MRISDIPNSDPVKEELRQKLVFSSNRYQFDPITKDKDKNMSTDDDEDNRLLIWFNWI